MPSQNLHVQTVDRTLVRITDKKQINVDYRMGHDVTRAVTTHRNSWNPQGYPRAAGYLHVQLFYSF